MAKYTSHIAASAQPSATSAEVAKEPLQVRIPVPVKRRFKAHAAMRGLEPNELFVEVWNHYERTFVATVDGSQA